MKRVVLKSRDRQGDWCDWRVVWLVSEHVNTWRIWSWRDPLTRLVHKQAMGERLDAL
jgi:hypothetical protein